MKALKIFLGMMAGMIAFSSCNDADVVEPTGTSTETTPSNDMLQLYPFIEGREQLERNWNDGNTLGLWITRGDLSDPYLGESPFHSNVKAKYYSDTWFMSSDVKLTKEPAYVYAYSPYTAECDPSAVTVECVTGTDYLYGTHFGNQKIDPKQVYVKEGRNKACLLMKHALGMVQIYAKKEQGVPPINVQKIEIRPAKGNSESELIPVEATLNIQNGILTNTRYGKYAQAISGWTLGDRYEETHRRDFPVIPQNFQAGKIELAITIGGIEYTKILQDNNWKRGYKYAYRVSFTGTDLTLQEVTIKPWDTIGDIFIEILDKVP